MSLLLCFSFLSSRALHLGKGQQHKPERKNVQGDATVETKKTFQLSEAPASCFSTFALIPYAYQEFENLSGHSQNYPNT